MGSATNIYRDATQASFMGISLAAAATVSLYLISSRLDAYLRMRRLPGARAVRFKGKYPFGIDLIMKQIQAVKDHRVLELIEEALKSTPNYTGEGSLASMRVILTADPDNIKAILASQFNDFGKGEPFHKEWKEFLGDSIFTTDGELWHKNRQLLRPMFVKERISDLDCFESHLETLFRAMAYGKCLDGPNQKVDLASGNGKVIEISDLFFRYTIDVVTDFLLGKDVQSLTNPHEPFADAFNEVQRIQTLRTRSGPLQRFIPLGSFHEALKVMDELSEKFIDRALDLSHEELRSKTKSDEGYTFLHELASFTRDRTMIRDQITAVLLAGRDTTAATLSWTIYELARHPEAVNRLRSEIIDQVGLDRAPTYNDLKSMKYLQAVMNETLRLYPAVPANMRLAVKDSTLPRGGGPDGLQPLPVLKDTRIGYSPFVMHRRPDLYPPPSETFAPVGEFSPDRWFHWQPRPWQYIPFNGGPRICIGQQFALTEMGYVLTRLFQRFERVESFMQDIDGGKPRMKADIVIQPADGVRVAFWHADSQGDSI